MPPNAPVPGPGKVGTAGHVHQTNMDSLPGGGFSPSALWLLYSHVLGPAAGSGPTYRWSVTRFKGTPAENPLELEAL